MATDSMIRDGVRRALVGAALMVVAGSVAAECGIEKGSVRILANDFPALHAVMDGAKACATGTVTVTVNHTAEHRNIQVAALTANPAQYTAAVIANGSIVPLLNEGLIRPLDEYVEKYGQALKKNQLITLDGKVMAVAFMANAQHMFYRADVLEQAGVEQPQSYEDVLAAAKVIREKGIMEYPVSGTYKAGWNLGEEFVNMYLGMGGEFFKPGSAEPNVNNDKGVKALETMKALTSYMNPDYLTFDTNAAQAEFEAGRTAMLNLWGSRASAVLDDEGSTPEVVSSVVLANAPTVGGGNTPATTLWWDGFSIAANISDEDAEATFKAMVAGIDPSTSEVRGDKGVWLTDGFKPGKLATGTVAAVQGGAKPYPLVPYIGLLHSALGAEISEFLQGNESAEQALSDVEAAYRASAKEGGYL